MGSIEDVLLDDPTQRTYGPFAPPDGLANESGINKQHPELPPEGVTYNLPIVNIEVKTVFHRNVVTNAWLKDKHAKLWTLNEAPWRSLDSLCVMFTGFEGFQRNNDGHWVITYRFEYRPPRAGRSWDTVEYTGNPGTFDTPVTAGWQQLSAHFDNFTVDDGDEDKPKERVVRNLSYVRIFNPYKGGGISSSQWNGFLDMHRQWSSTKAHTIPTIYSNTTVASARLASSSVPNIPAFTPVVIDRVVNLTDLNGIVSVSPVRYFDLDLSVS